MMGRGRRMRGRRVLAVGALAGTAGYAMGRRGGKQSAEPQPAAQAQPAESSSETAEPDYTAELEKLAQLKSQGILTDEEFAAKKKQILGL